MANDIIKVTMERKNEQETSWNVEIHGTHEEVIIALDKLSNVLARVLDDKDIVTFLMM